ncbi:hypothetical protein CC2G_010992 [Coprinopsis cinerea AmutBmut pab1-1]|nr:hypothetical protein CC2G_010992 [Coprinopsis cinerea AmutBmut pab1-1]
MPPTVETYNDYLKFRSAPHLKREDVIASHRRRTVTPAPPPAVPKIFLGRPYYPSSPSPTMVKRKLGYFDPQGVGPGPAEHVMDALPASPPSADVISSSGATPSSAEEASITYPSSFPEINAAAAINDGTIPSPPLHPNGSTLEQQQDKQWQNDQDHRLVDPNFTNATPWPYLALGVISLILAIVLGYALWNCWRSVKIVRRGDGEKEGKEGGLKMMVLGTGSRLREDDESSGYIKDPNNSNHLSPLKSTHYQPHSLIATSPVTPTSSSSARTLLLSSSNSARKHTSFLDFGNEDSYYSYSGPYAFGNSHYSSDSAARSGQLGGKPGGLARLSAWWNRASRTGESKNIGNTVSLASMRGLKSPTGTNSAASSTTTLALHNSHNHNNRTPVSANSTFVGSSVHGHSVKAMDDSGSRRHSVILNGSMLSPNSLRSGNSGAKGPLGAGGGEAPIISLPSTCYIPYTPTVKSLAEKDTKGSGGGTKRVIGRF